MGVRFPGNGAVGNVLGSIGAAGAEIVLTVSNPLVLPLDSAQVLIHWFVLMTIGASGTAVVMRVRRGTTTGGTALGTWTQAVTAGTSVILSGCYGDTPGAVTAQQYALTASLTGATGASATGDCALIAYAL